MPKRKNAFRHQMAWRISISGDGTFDDSQGVASLISTSRPHFVPGRIGQAFRFNGSDNFLEAEGSYAFCTFCAQAWTESLFIKLDSTPGEMTILDRVRGVAGRERRIYKSENGRIVVEGDGDPKSSLFISTMDPLRSGQWYHLAAVTDNDRVFLYLDGVLQGQQIVRQRSFVGSGQLSVFIGASQGRSNFLTGLVDEIAVYNRALGPDEVKKIAGSCSVLK